MPSERLDIVLEQDPSRRKRQGTELRLDAVLDLLRCRLLTMSAFATLLSRGATALAAGVWRSPGSAEHGGCS
jgi:hypothetical protein